MRVVVWCCFPIQAELGRGTRNLGERGRLPPNPQRRGLDGAPRFVLPVAQDTDTSMVEDRCKQCLFGGAGSSPAAGGDFGVKCPCPIFPRQGITLFR